MATQMIFDFLVDLFTNNDKAFFKYKKIINEHYANIVRIV